MYVCKYIGTVCACLCVCVCAHVLQHVPCSKVCRSQKHSTCLPHVHLQPCILLNQDKPRQTKFDTWLSSHVTVSSMQLQCVPKCCGASCVRCWMRFAVKLEKKRKEKTTPFGVNLMRSQVVYRAAQGGEPCIDSSASQSRPLRMMQHVSFIHALIKVVV